METHFDIVAGAAGEAAVCLLEQVPLPRLDALFEAEACESMQGTYYILLFLLAPVVFHGWRL
jgi:hypothetical protein